MDFSAFEGITAAAGEKKAESKHYIPFNKTEWDAMEKVAGRELKPNQLKKMLLAMFAGNVAMIKPSVLAIYQEVCPKEDLETMLAERASK